LERGAGIATEALAARSTFDDIRPPWPLVIITSDICRRHILHGYGELPTPLCFLNLLPEMELRGIRFDNELTDISLTRTIGARL